MIIMMNKRSLKKITDNVSHLSVAEMKKENKSLQQLIKAAMDEQESLRKELGKFSSVSKGPT